MDSTDYREHLLRLAEIADVIHAADNRLLIKGELVMPPDLDEEARRYQESIHARSRQMTVAASAAAIEEFRALPPLAGC